jgi:serine/threonine-protein kinase
MTMNRTRWQYLSQLLDEALALPAADRAAWLAAWLERDPALGLQLQTLLRPAAGQHADPRTTVPDLASFSQHLDAALHHDEAADAARLTGTQRGPWLLLRKIGEGGMGQVWLARRADGLYDAHAAIKLLRSDLDAASLQARFARERAALARLNHPAVARLLDAGMDQGQAYLVLEYVQGSHLVDHVRHHCPTVAERVRLLLRMADAVDHAHAQLIVHRDLKPSNVLVTPGGEPKLLDFGIAGLLDDGEPVDTELTRQTGRGLTLGYAAPEQILGARSGTGADVFSLGVMLFELLSGTLPFTPRNATRLAAERAVLHDEPHRLGALLAAGRPLAEADAELGPGRPTDARRAMGDLEAIVAKALRKDPTQRYGSVRLFMEDLQAWLGHRPVSAQRDHWRHRTHLWLRRNAVAAGGVAAVVLSLALGLAAATWQWQRAQQAARQSDAVTTYLTELLASASPDRHGGTWPTVLQLLDASRVSLPGQFADDPATRLRLLQVLADTYHQLNRFDVAMPLRDEQVALSTQLLGASDPSTLRARSEQARTYQVQGLFDKAITVLEPLRTPFSQAFGRQSPEYRQLLYVLHGSYSRVGRFDDADRILAEAGALTEAAFAPGSEERLSHLNHLQVLRVGQGRLLEAQAALRATERWWTDPELANAPIVLVLRRNTIAVQSRLSLYDGIEARTQALLADMDRLLGPGNDMAAGMRIELARYHTDIGQYRQALAQRQDNLARALAAKVEHPAVLLPLQVHVLLAEGQAHAAEPDTLRQRARELLATAQAQAARLGYVANDIHINLVRLALLLDDATLAAEALAPLQADNGLRLVQDQTLASRMAQIQGQVARLQGDLPRSRVLLQQRMTWLDRAAEKRVLPAWTSALDLAWTLVLLGDPGAADALAQADTRRPQGLPAPHPLDAVRAYLGARLGPGGADSAGARAALATLQQRQGRSAGGTPGPGTGSLAGAFN